MRRNKDGRFTRREAGNPSAEIPTDFDAATRTPKARGVKPKPRTGAERYRHEDDLLAQVTRTMGDGL